VGALAGSALVVVHSVAGPMFPVHVPVVQIVHVVAMQHGCMPTAGAVGVVVLFSLVVLGRRQGDSFRRRRLEKINICAVIDAG
jgi:hypothetical protein